MPFSIAAMTEHHSCGANLRITDTVHLLSGQATELKMAKDEPFDHRRPPPVRLHNNHLNSMDNLCVNYLFSIYIGHNFKPFFHRSELVGEMKAIVAEEIPNITSAELVPGLEAVVTWCVNLRTGG